MKGRYLQLYNIFFIEAIGTLFVLYPEIRLIYADFCSLVNRLNPIMDQDVYKLTEFSGSLEVLLLLVQKQEMDICSISLKEVLDQFLEKAQKEFEGKIDKGSEFISSAAALIYMKSKNLLPRHEQQTEEEELELEDPNFSIIHHLVDYCRFKDIAKELSEKGNAHLSYSRGAEEVAAVKKGMGIAHLSLTDLAELFQQAINKLASQTRIVEEEVWRVGDKIKFLRNLIKKDKKIPFMEFLTQSRSKDELIVTFLAVLELMKLGELLVYKEENTIILSIS